MTIERKHPEHGVFPDRPPIFAVDEEDAEAAIGIIPPGKASAGEADTPEASKQNDETFQPGMMGDGTEEQNLGQRGKPESRIKEAEVDAVFDKKS